MKALTYSDIRANLKAALDGIVEDGGPVVVSRRRREAVVMGAIDRAPYRATVKEFGDGTPYLAFEPQKRELPRLAGATLSFHLRKGVTLDQAQQLAADLNSLIETLAVTQSG